MYTIISLIKGLFDKVSRESLKMRHPKCVSSKRESESEVTYGQVWWPILGICALHLTHPKCTHTAVNTHTVNTHPEQWAAIYAAAPGEQLGVWCLAQGHLSRGIEGGESAFKFTPPTYNSCRTWDSNSQPLDYESDSLTIRPRLRRK